MSKEYKKPCQGNGKCLEEITEGNERGIEVEFNQQDQE